MSTLDLGFASLKGIERVLPPRMGGWTMWLLPALLLLVIQVSGAGASDTEVTEVGQEIMRVCPGLQIGNFLL